MTEIQKHTLDMLLSNEQACVSYLFKKRWPWGFRCPFCGTKQEEMAPAYRVVCRYCGKQTSITAHTLMHGTKKSLVAWMRIAWQFCFQDQGISAKEVQRLMRLSSYQTAWSWLQKIRHGAALAESALVCGSVLFDCALLPIPTSAEHIAADVGMALELNPRKEGEGRVRFALLAARSPESISEAINCLVRENTILLLSNPEWPCRNWLQKRYRQEKANREQLERGQLLVQQTLHWLKSVYRGAIDTTYLETYLAEFSFRYNTASWPDRMAVLDHLLTGLLSSVGNRPIPQPAPIIR